MSESKHTPLPWKMRQLGKTRCVIEGPGEDCCIAMMTRWLPPFDAAEQKANADFIVKACNAHDELVEALRAMIVLENERDWPMNQQWGQAILTAQAVLAKAEKTN
jgi:hypothetical protein